jgi:peptidyl-prolyl cis-trans isomerase B (cyclophilin B)
VIDGFMIQGGGFDQQFRQVAEAQPDTPAAQAGVKAGLKNVAGTIAMARTSNPDSATAQFFINVADNALVQGGDPRGDGHGYAVFGKVVGGTEVIDQIEKVKTGRSGFHDDVPVEDVVIQKAVVV